MKDNCFRRERVKHAFLLKKWDMVEHNVFFPFEKCKAMRKSFRLRWEIYYYKVIKSY